MNIEAVNEFYSISKDNGFEGGVNDYVQELKSNPSFLESEYNNSLNIGYEDTIDDFANLLGVQSEELKKKNSDLSLAPEGGPSSLVSTPIETALPISNDLDIQENQNYNQPLLSDEQQEPEQNISIQASSYMTPRTEDKTAKVFNEDLNKTIPSAAPITTKQTTSDKDILLDRLAGKPSLKQIVSEEVKDIADDNVNINGYSVNKNFVWTKEDQKASDEKFNQLQELYTTKERIEFKPIQLYTTETEISGANQKDIFGGQFTKNDYNNWAKEQVEKGNAEFVMDFEEKEKGKPSIGFPKVDNDAYVIKPTEKGLLEFNKQIEEQNKLLSTKVEEENKSISYENLGKMYNPLQMPRTAMQDVIANYSLSTGKTLTNEEIEKLSDPQYLKQIQYETQAGNLVKSSDGELSFEQALEKTIQEDNKPDKYYSDIAKSTAGTALWGIKKYTEELNKSDYETAPATSPEELEMWKGIFQNPTSPNAIKFGKWWDQYGSKQYGSGEYLKQTVQNISDRRNLMRSFENYLYKDVDVLGDANKDVITSNKKKVRDALEKGDLKLADELIKERYVLEEKQKYINEELDKNKTLSNQINKSYNVLKEQDNYSGRFEAAALSHSPLEYVLDLYTQAAYGATNAIKSTATGLGVVLNTVLRDKDLGEYLRYQNDKSTDIGGVREKSVTTDVKEYSDVNGNKYEEISGKLFKVKDGVYEYISKPNYDDLKFNGEKNISELGGIVKEGTQFVTTVAVAEATGAVVLKPVTTGLGLLVRGAESVDRFRKFNSIMNKVAEDFGVSKSIVKNSWTYENAVARARLAESVFGDSNVTMGLRKYAQFLSSPRNANATGFFFQTLNHDYNYALQNGIEDEDSARLYAFGKGVLNYALMLANPTEKVFGTIANDSRAMVNSLLKGRIPDYKIALNNVVTNALGSSEQALKFAGEMQLFNLGNKAVDRTFDYFTDSKLYKKDETGFKDFLLSELLVPFATSFIGGLKGTGKGVKEFADMNQYEILVEIAKQKDAIPRLNEYIENKIFFPEDRAIAREYVKKVSEIKKNVSITPDANSYTPMALYNSSELITKLNKKQSELESVAEPFKDRVKEEIKEIKKEINKVLDQDLLDQKKIKGEEEIQNEKNITSINLNAKKGEDVYQVTKEDITKPKEDAIQEQATNESVLGKEQPAVELQGVGEGNTKPEVVTEQKETITPEGKEEVALGESIRQDVRGLVNEGVSLGEAIRQAADKNNISEAKATEVLQKINKAGELPEVVAKEETVNPEVEKETIVPERKEEVKTKTYDFTGEKYDAIQDKIDSLTDELDDFLIKEKGLTEDEAVKEFLFGEYSDFPKKKELDDLIDERNKIWDDSAKYINNKIEELGSKNELSEESIKYIKYRIDSNNIGALERFSDKNLKDIAEGVAMKELEEQGLDYEGVMGFYSGWGQAQKEMYLKDIASKVKNIQQELYNSIGNEINKQKETIVPEGKETQKITLDEALKTDVKDQSGLKKVSDFLDDALNKLDEFEKSRPLSVKIPFDTDVVRLVLNALKKIVGQGVNLEQAIKKFMAENDLVKKYNLTKEDVYKMTYPEEKSIEKENKLTDVLKNENAVEEFDKLPSNKKDSYRKSAIEEFKTNAKKGKEKLNQERKNNSEYNNKTIEEFTSIDPDLFTDPKDSLEALKILDNYNTTGSTERMGEFTAKAKGEQGAREAVEKNLKAKIIKKRGSEKAGQAGLSYAYNDVLFFEKLFNGKTKGEEARKLIGVTDIGTSFAKATNESRKAVDEYQKKFGEKKPNGKKFNTLSNNIERGIVSEMLARPAEATTKEQIQEEFDKNKQKIEESIQNLKRGDRSNRDLSAEIKEVYDKILKDSNNIEEVKAKADKINVDAVDYWIDLYAKNYDQFKEHALSMHGIDLGKYEYYTPRRVKSVRGEFRDTLADIDGDVPTFIVNSGLSEGEAKSFMKRLNSKGLPPKTFLDLNFDMKNANAFKDMMVDMKSTPYIKQAKAFLESKDFNKILPKSEIGTAREAEEGVLLENRVKMISKNVRNSNRFDYSDLSAIERRADKIAKVGAAYKLASLSMPLVQTIPIAANTLVNGAKVHLDILTSPEKLKFINESGYKISNRGLHSQADIRTINRLLDLAAESKGERALQAVKKLQDFYLKNLLERPDVYIAKASWLGYYEKSLKEQAKKGEISKDDVKNIDYSTHEINDKAAEYADSMVDSKQNTSMAEFQGQLFNQKGPSKSIMLKLLFGMSNFRMNAAANFGAAESVLFSKSSTIEDKKIAAQSMAAYLTEQVLYRGMQVAITAAFKAGANAYLGREEDKEDFWDTIKYLGKQQASNIYTDIVSTVPIADTPIQFLTNYTADMVQKYSGVEKENRINISDPYPSDWFSMLGMYGIAPKRGYELIQLIDLANTGSYEKDGRIETISLAEQKKLKKIIAVKVLTTAGVLPADADKFANNVINTAKRDYESAEKKAMKKDKEDKSNTEKEYKKEVLEKLLKKHKSDAKHLQIIKDELDRLKDETSDEYRVLKEKEDAKALRDYELLYDPEKDIYYKNKSDMKNYNKDLYDVNFGPYSEYGKEHELELKVKQEIDKMMKMKKNVDLGFDENYNLEKKKKKGFGGGFGKGFGGGFKKGFGGGFGK